MILNYKDAVEAPLLTVDEERAALHHWQEEGDQASLELLLRSHARLVHAQANRWASNPVEQEDLVAEGMIGLMRAAELFNLDLDVRFSTYAQWWVRTSVTTAFARMRSIVSMPSRAYLDARMGRLSGDQLNAVLQASQIAVSLNAGEDDGRPRQEAELRAPGPTPEEHAETASGVARLRQVLAEALGQLDATDRELLQRRKLANEPESVEETAAWLGVRVERVAPFERRAMARLRLRLERLGCTPAMLC